jgi:hypothetical protein
VVGVRCRVQGARCRVQVKERSDEPTNGSSAKPNPDIPKNEESSGVLGAENHRSHKVRSDAVPHNGRAQSTEKSRSFLAPEGRNICRIMDFYKKCAGAEILKRHQIFTVANKR